MDCLLSSHPAAQALHRILLPLIALSLINQALGIYLTTAVTEIPKEVCLQVWSVQSVFNKLRMATIITIQVKTFRVHQRHQRMLTMIIVRTKDLLLTISLRITAKLGIHKEEVEVFLNYLILAKANLIKHPIQIHHTAQLAQIDHHLLLRISSSKLHSDMRFQLRQQLNKLKKNKPTQMHSVILAVCREITSTTIEVARITCNSRQLQQRLQ